MKKIFLTLVTLCMLCASAGASAAVELSDNNPRVYVNDREIVFDKEETKPVISMKGDTLIPIRRVLESMGASVDWNGEDRTVYVKAKDNISRMLFTIDSDEAKRYTLTTVTSFDVAPVSLSTPATIVNDRTLVPLRAIVENFGDDIEWDGDSSIITIKTKEYTAKIDKLTEARKAEEETYTYNPQQDLPNVCLETSAEGIKEGDEVYIDVVLKNTDKCGEVNFSSMAAAVRYNRDNFAYAGTDAIVNGEVFGGTLAAANDEFMGSYLKSVYLIMPSEDNKYPLTDGTVMRIKFIALNDLGGEFSLSDGISSVGADTAVYLEENESYFSIEDPTELYIDTTPIAVK